METGFGVLPAVPGRRAPVHVRLVCSTIRDPRNIHVCAIPLCVLLAPQVTAGIGEGDGVVDVGGEGVDEDDGGVGDGDGDGGP